MVTMRQINDYAKQIVDLFHPAKIILFGSYAYGKPTEDSDVDLMILMRHAKGDVEGAIAIRAAIPTPFSKDILVRNPQTFQERIRLGDSFYREIDERGRVLYEAVNPQVDKKAEGDFKTAGREFRVSNSPNHDAVCFHVQQCVEKYFKARLEEASIHIPKTHDLERLL